MSVKEQAIENLKDFHRIMQGGPTFFLMDGTLLGAYRDGDFCPGDEDDLDVGIVDAEYDRINALMPAFEAAGFKRHKNFIHRGRVEGFGLLRGESHFDVIRVNRHPKRAECYNLGQRTDVAGVCAFVYPAKHHESFEEIEFYGLRFKIPADPEGFLAARYGDWRTPIPRPGFCWWTQANRDSIRNDYDY